MVDLTINGGAGEFLDPAVGMGAFTDVASFSNVNITACEIDQNIICELKEKTNYKMTLCAEDYLYKEFDIKFDYIVCNPPYNKFQEIANRDNLRDLFHKYYNIRMSGYSNLCVYFLVKSMNELKKNGRCCYIIPYEFMNTGYGKVIKEYLLKSKMLKTVFKFDYNMSLFDEAITTSCILLLENCNHGSVEFISVEDIDELKNNTFKNKKVYLNDELDPTEKWTKYFESANKKENKRYNNLVKLSHFGRISRGIATGANSYFALNKEMIDRYNLSEQVCLPCLIKSPDVQDIVITKKTFEMLSESNKKVYLFDGNKVACECDKAYIELGEKQNIHKAYLTSHRHPWYSIEKKEAAPILISVFNRNRIKIVRNEFGIKNLTTFHGLFVNNKDEKFIDLFFCYLLSPIAQELLYSSRREYGRGLEKFEPGDLHDADMLNLDIISDEDRKKVSEIYDEIKEKQALVRISELDGIFRKYFI